MSDIVGIQEKDYSEKLVSIGTHRSCTPEETLARVRPFLLQMGITRVAEITHLDDLDIPIFQAIRPNSRNVSVSQGKGVTKALAKASAVMESIETWHAEQPQLLPVYASVRDMDTQIPYAVYDLSLNKRHILHDALELEWFPASTLQVSGLYGNDTYIPADLIRLDFTAKDQWCPPLFSVQSNGLASGNTLEEAMLHALYEIVERDTFERVRREEIHAVRVEPTTVDGMASMYLIEKLQRANTTFQIFYVQGATGIPCFKAMITSPSYSIVTSGYGCHLDRDVALSRALSEAAQTRLTMIAGSRDDIDSLSYRRLQGRMMSFPSTTQIRQNFQEVPSIATPYLQKDLQEVICRVLSVFRNPPIVVDLTHQVFNIPVVFVVVPRTLFLEVLR